MTRTRSSCSNKMFNSRMSAINWGRNRRNFLKAATILLVISSNQLRGAMAGGYGGYGGGGGLAGSSASASASSFASSGAGGWSGGAGGGGGNPFLPGEEDLCLFSDKLMSLID
ncbi:keratin, type II cytoskeletal 68 kDa, component IB-like [Lucilia cuprina]|uniref:keratin, type II cytoskeletal 68 kDa, component IB-like n=1 Tax=Lucilia cuprina TaxID=7375 RepID=UPI001F06037B|nr:keratin, type II cytoskeletal 68 kDa, component IB-like [Lucilia cuprina]